MNTAELAATLRIHSVDPSDYSLVGGLPNEAYVLALGPTGWSVYYSEKGVRTGEENYSTEHDACEALLAKLLKL